MNMQIARRCKRCGNEVYVLKAASEEMKAVIMRCPTCEKNVTLRQTSADTRDLSFEALEREKKEQEQRYKDGNYNVEGEVSIIPGSIKSKQKYLGTDED